MRVSLLVWHADGEQAQVELEPSTEAYRTRWLPHARASSLPLLASIAEGEVVEYGDLGALVMELESFVTAVRAAGDEDLADQADDMRQHVSAALDADVLDAFLG